MSWEWVLAGVLIVILAAFVLLLRSRTRLFGMLEPRDTRLMREAVQQMRRTNDLLEKKVADLETRLNKIETRSGVSESPK